MPYPRNLAWATSASPYVAYEAIATGSEWSSPSVVLIGVWLYLSNALILLAYRATQFRAERSNGHRGGATAGRG